MDPSLAAQMADAILAGTGAPAAPTHGTSAGTATLAAPMDLGGATELPIGVLYDLTLPVTIELGRTSMTVADVLRLGRGSVIQLERLAGEPVDVYVGERRFAEAEVVVLGEHFGVRITRILSAPVTAEPHE